MRTCKTFDGVRGGEATLGGGDVVGLFSDVLEPSHRHGGHSVHGGRREAESSDSRERCDSLSELSVPRTGARVGFREFLD
jgi:hypothetical protein